MKRLPAVLASILLVTACSGTTPTPQPTTGPTVTPGPVASPSATPGPTAPAGAIELARSDVERTVVDPAEAAVAADAINAFGLDLYARLASEPGNIVISPASVAIALSMTRVGAVGQTGTELDAVLRDLGAENLADAANALDAALAARNGTFPDSAGESHDVVLRIANAIFPQHDMALQATFLDAMATRYGAGAWLVDFVADPEAARLAINAWVADQTEGRIPEILKPGQVSGATRLALANAIYLKAAWLNPFALDSTAPGAFSLADGSSVQVPMMRATTRFAYAAGAGWRAVELPYIGGQLAMIVILPDDMEAFERSLDAATLGRITATLATAQVDLTMPRWDTESNFELNGFLAAMGMPTAFDPNRADFSGITTDEALFISFVIHQANITVDEAGTEAAAATVVGMDTTGGPVEPVTLRLDRPFLFALRDVPTSAIVFLGRVADPSITR